MNTLTLHHDLTAAAAIWFEIWGLWIRVKKSIFPGKFSKIFDFFQAISPKNSIFSGNSTKDFDFSRQISEKFRFFRQVHEKIRFFMQTFAIIIQLLQGNIILFLFRSYHFRTYFL